MLALPVTCSVNISEIAYKNKTSKMRNLVIQYLIIIAHCVSVLSQSHIIITYQVKLILRATYALRWGWAYP